MPRSRQPLTAGEIARAERLTLFHRRNLSHFLAGFFCSQALFEHLKTSSPPGVSNPMSFAQWRVIPARDAALNLYHFQHSLKYVRSNVSRTTMEFDPDQLRDAVKAFAKAFPHCENIRDRIAHAGEEVAPGQDFSSAMRAKVGDNFSAHSAGVPGGTVEYLSGDHYFVAGRDAKVFHLEVSQRTFSLLNDLYLRAATSFKVINI